MRTPTAFVGLLLFLVACGSSGDTAAPASTTTSPAPSSTTSPPPTAATGPTATTAAPGACPLAALPAGAGSATVKMGDFNGDKLADTLRSYKLGNDWHLRVELAGGTTGDDVVVAGADAGTGVKAVGGFNIDENLADEAFAVVGGGASTTIVGLFVFAKCALVRVTEKGVPAGFPVGASVLNRSGVSCVPGTAIQALRGTAPPATGTPFAVVRSTYDLAGTTLVLANTSQASIAAGDPALAPSAAFDCGGLTLD